MYSLVEATFGAGYTLGPGFGSWLYSYGGFLVPFCFSGGALLVTGKPSSIILSSTISISRCDMSVQHQTPDKVGRGSDYPNQVINDASTPP